MNKKINKKILAQQQNEITESKVYEALSELSENPHNKKILKNIAVE